jgi:hypothetical protein
MQTRRPVAAVFLLCLGLITFRNSIRSEEFSDAKRPSAITKPEIR